MAFPLPTPRELASSLEGLMESRLRTARPSVDPAAIARAVRSPRGVIAALCRSFVMLLYGVHLHLRWWGDQYFPDTAEEEALLRHASIWGLTRREATKAVGRATVAGAFGAVVPAGRLLQGSGVTYEVDAAVAVGGDGTAVLALTASDAGAIGNADSGTQLSFLDEVDGLDPQSATVDGEGIAGGEDIEDVEALRARLVARIQQPPHGGADFDYATWVKEAFAVSHVKVLPNWGGYGSVGVCVAMGTAASPLAPTLAELDAIAAYLDPLRPVTAEVIMVAAVILTCDLTISVDPDTLTVRAAVETAWRSLFAREAEIGKKLPLSRMSERISAAAGEYAHKIVSPAASIDPTATQLPVPGTITFTSADT